MSEPLEQYPYGERRLSIRLLRYWQEKRGVRAMPVEQDIDPDVLAEDWDYCFLLQSRDVANVQDYNFTYLGQQILRAYADRGFDDANPFIVGPNAFVLSRHFAQVIEAKAPVFDEGEFMRADRKLVLYRQVLLPLGTEEKGVEAIFGGMNYRIVG